MTQSFVGQNVRRREDVRLLTGGATFVDDVHLPGMLHAVVLRSPHPHARIIAIDTSDALMVDGVISVFTFEDIADVAKPIPMRMHKLPGLERFLQLPLARDKVRYVGEPIAVAVADSQHVAEDALDAIHVTYEPLRAVVNVRDALRDEVLVHEEAGTNLGAQRTIGIGDVDSVFQDAEYVRKEEFWAHRHTGVPMETRGLISSYDAEKDELTVWGASKIPYLNRSLLSTLLDFPEARIHFIELDVGGGFGVRGEFYPEDFLIPFMAWKLGRPVKWIEDRREHLMAANHSREILWNLEIATRKDGTILGLKANAIANGGAYVRTHGGIVATNAAKSLAGPYRIPNYACTYSVVMTNKTGVGTYRAPGFYESCFALERLLDMVASDLDLDPVELRERNLVKASEMPYEVGAMLPGELPTVYDSGDYASALHHALKAADYENLIKLQGQLIDGRYHGIGLACYNKHTGFSPGDDPSETARVVVEAGGHVTLYLGIASLGQGHGTIMSQICADALGVPMGTITVIYGDTDLVPQGGGTYASRATVIGGSAVHLAAQNLQERVLALAAAQLSLQPEQLVLRNGEVHREDEPEGPVLLDLVTVLELTKGERADGEVVLEETAQFIASQHAYVYGTHIAHVAVDPETGKVELLRYICANDVGRAVNPMLVQGQVYGAAVQGIGATLLEELVYDENGQLLTTTLMHYLLPSTTDVPPIESILLEEAPSPLNPLGVKGAGELGIVATGGAIANAVSRALASLGVQVRSLPLSPNAVRALIREASEG
jgi:carbon-monoxide dehydrogenase large subunit